MERPSLNIGWIGLGKMGYPMALNLLKNGNKVSIFNRSKKDTSPHENAGGHISKSIKELASCSNVVFTMVSDDKAIEEICLGENGIFSTLKNGSVLIEMSTISPYISAKISDTASSKGIAYLRAPVNGTVMQAETSTLVILVSGEQRCFDNHVDLLNLLGNKIYYTGNGEQARYLKLCLNTMVGITSSMIGEALTLGEAGGLNWDTMIEIIANSAVGSPLINYKKETLKKRNFTPAFSATQMAKDFDIILDTAKLKDVPMPIASVVRQHWSAMISTKRGDLDYFACVEMLEEMAGINRK